MLESRRHSERARSNTVSSSRALRYDGGLHQQHPSRGHYDSDGWDDRLEDRDFSIEVADADPLRGDARWNVDFIGTPTNILSSDVSARLIDRPFGTFEFTQLGILVLFTGIIYFATVGRFLVPERIDAREQLVSEFELAENLTEVTSSPPKKARIPRRR